MRKTFISMLGLLAMSCALVRPPQASRSMEAVAFEVVNDGLSLPGPVSSVAEGPGGVIFVAFDDGRLSCVGGDGTRILWSFDAGAAFPIPPVAGGTGVCAASGDDTLHALDMDGGLVFSKRIGERVTALAAEAEGRLYVGTENGRLLALDAMNNGVLLWHFQAGGAIRSKPLVSGGRIFFGADDGKLYALDRNGTPVWSFQSGGEIWVSPVAAGGRIVFGADDRVLTCLSAATGKKRWSFKLGGSPVHPPLAVGKRVVLVASNSVCYSLSLKTGEIRWWKAVPSRVLHAPVIAAGAILVPSASSGIMALDPATGNDAGGAPISGDIAAGILWVDPHVFCVVRNPEGGGERAVFLKKQAGEPGRAAAVEKKSG